MDRKICFKKIKSLYNENKLFRVSIIDDNDYFIELGFANDKFIDIINEEKGIFTIQPKHLKNLINSLSNPSYTYFPSKKLNIDNSYKIKEIDTRLNIILNNEYEFIYNMFELKIATFLKFKNLSGKNKLLFSLFNEFKNINDNIVVNLFDNRIDINNINEEFLAQILLYNILD